jgi:hypothetical protein
MQKKPALTLLPGGRVLTRKLQGITVSLVDKDTPLPTGVQRIFEEDTHLVLTGDPVVEAPVAHPIRIMTEILDSKPRKPGSLVMEQYWYAVVIDLDTDELCQPDWVQQACKQIFYQTAKQLVPTLVMPLLGSVHGPIPAGKSLNLILSTLTATEKTGLNHLQIEVPAPFLSNAAAILGRHHKNESIQ